MLILASLSHTMTPHAMGVRARNIVSSLHVVFGMLGRQSEDVVCLALTSAV